MSAAKSQKDSGIPADLQPFYDKPRTASRTWARWIVRLVTLVILATLAFMFVRWVWHQTHTDSAKPASNTSQKAASDSSNGHSTKPITLGGSSESDTSSSQDSSTTDSSASDTPSTQTSGGNSAAAAQSVGEPSTLANTGPGQTLGIFVASSLLFALLYELRLRSKTS